MPVSSVDPNLRESQSTQRRQSNTAQDFADFVGTVGAGVGPTAAEVRSPGHGAVTSAAISGVVGATNAYTNPMGGYGGSAPYYSSPTLSTSTVGSGPMLATQYNPGTGTFGGTVGVGAPGAVGIGGSNGISNDTLAKQQLFQDMNDANWEMLVAQVTVNNLSRDYQARSNILKTKSDTEVSIARNYRG